MTNPRWPYPSYGDRMWLGGERGGDRHLAAVVRTMRALATEAGHRPTGEAESLLAGLSDLASLGERISWALLSLVGEARAQDISWATIGGALGVTKQAAQQRFAPYVKEAMARGGAPDA